MEHFSDRLRHARKERKLSQAELARASGLSQGAISSYETGTRRTTTGLIQLAQALNVDPAWLINGTGTMEFDAKALASHTSPARLDEVQPQPITAAWPFTTVEAGEYWALSEAQRHIVEQTVAAMIIAMRAQDDSA